MEKGIIFVAGTYGVGKSTLCEKIGKHLSIPFYSAGDLISEINGEKYGSNKVVSDKKGNQDILIEAVNHKLKSEPSIILAGHFCIFDCQNHVERLPEYVFDKLNIKSILLLEASVERICEYNGPSCQDICSRIYREFLRLFWALRYAASCFACVRNMP